MRVYRYVKQLPKAVEAWVRDAAPFAYSHYIVAIGNTVYLQEPARVLKPMTTSKGLIVTRLVQTGSFHRSAFAVKKDGAVWVRKPSHWYTDKYESIPISLRLYLKEQANTVEVCDPSVGVEENVTLFQWEAHYLVNKLLRARHPLPKSDWQIRIRELQREFAKFTKHFGITAQLFSDADGARIVTHQALGILADKPVYEDLSVELTF